MLEPQKYIYYNVELKLKPLILWRTYIKLNLQLLIQNLTCESYNNTPIIILSITFKR